MPSHDSDHTIITCQGTNVSGHNRVWAQTCVGKNVSGHNRVWAQTYVGTNVCGHKRVWAQSCVGTNVCGHNRVWAQTLWAQTCLGTIVCGHKRVWAQSCLGTNVYRHKCVGTNVSIHIRVWAQSCGLNRVSSIMYGHKRGGTTNSVYKTVRMLGSCYFTPIHYTSRDASQAKYLEVTDEHEPRHEPDCTARGAA